MVYLELDDLLAIASEVLGLKVDALLRVTDLGLADSAVAVHMTVAVQKLRQAQPGSGPPHAERPAGGATAPSGPEQPSAVARPEQNTAGSSNDPGTETGRLW